jgi:hypothetical protein
MLMARDMGFQMQAIMPRDRAPGIAPLLREFRPRKPWLRQVLLAIEWNDIPHGCRT